MQPFSHQNSSVNMPADTHRHAYNIAFDALGLSWHWDQATYLRLHALSHDGVRVYLETEQSHLLSAYEADFLIHAIETAKALNHNNPMADQIRSIPKQTGQRI